MRRPFPLLMPVVLATLAASCASSGGVPRPFPGAAAPPAAVGPDAGSAPEPAAPEPAVVTTALMYEGVPYRDGGSNPSGFDCSGFVQWVFGQNGVPLPRAVRDQFRWGKAVPRDEIRPGDLVFFHTVDQGASHVGIALDGERFVHAPSSHGVVRVERYTSEYWAKRYVGARRIQDSASARN